MARPDVVEVPLFSGYAAGYGDAHENPFRQGAYKSTLHGLVDSGGFAPFFAVDDAVPWEPATVVGAHVAGAVPWENASGHPTIIVALTRGQSGLTGVTNRINPAGTVSQEETNTGWGTMPLAIHSDGGTTPYLFACYDTNQNIRYRTTGAVWANTAGTPNQARGLLSENGNLWAVLTNGYQVRKWAAGLDPKAATAGAAIDVGTSAWKINGAGLLGHSVIVWVKPDGIYLFDIETERMENLWEGLADAPHPDTGKGTFTWGQEVYVPIGNSGMVRIVPGPVPLPASPLPPEALPDQSVAGRSRIIALDADHEALYAAPEPFTQRLGVGGTPPVYVRTTKDDDAYNNRDAVATDEDLATSFAHADMEGGGVARMNIGSIIRFRGVYLDVVGGDTLALSSVEYYNGAWTALTVRDYTNSLVVSGAIVPAVPIPADWAQTAVNSVTAYWLRLNVMAQTTDTIYREIRILPEVAALPAGDGVALSGDDEAGVRQHILRGYAVGDQMVWDDVCSYDGNMAEALVFSQVLAAGGGRSLYALGPQGATRIPFSVSARPAEERYPQCQNGFASLWRSGYRSETRPGRREPTIRKGIDYVTVLTRNFDEANDLIQVWGRFDGEAPFLIGAGRQAEVTLEHGRSEAWQGHRYEIIVGIEDGARDELAPIVTDVIAGIYEVSGRRAHE